MKREGERRGAATVWTVAVGELTPIIAEGVMKRVS